MSLHDDLWDWTQKLADWQSDLLGRVLTGAGVDDDAVLANVLSAAGKAAMTPNCVRAVESDLPTSANSPSGLRLEAILDLENVGLIDDGERLAFNKNGITLIYGDNGAGKSSYSRILKASCRARGTAAKVLPNAFKVGAPGARSKAKVAFDVGSNTSVFEWSESAPPDQRLKGVSVFDSASARHYIDDKGRVAYQPAELEVITRLAVEQDRLGKRIEDMLHEIERGRPRFSDAEFMPGTQVRRLFDGINESTDIAPFEALAAVSDDEQIRRQELRRRLLELKQKNPHSVAKTNRERAKTLRQFAAQFDESGVLVGDDGSAAWAKLQERLAIAKQAASQFSAPGKPAHLLGVGSPSGTRMWSTAKEFAAQHGLGLDASASHGSCPLCLQSLNKLALERFGAFEEFVVGAIQTALDGVSKEHLELATRLNAAALVNDQDLAVLDALLSDVPALLKGTVEFRQTVAERATVLLSAAVNDGSPMSPVLPQNPGEAIRERANYLDADALELEQSADSTAATKIGAELAELDSRVALSQRRSDIQLAVSLARDAAVYRKAQGLLRTQALTAKKTEWADAAVTAALRAALTKELNALGADHLQVRLASKGKKGETELALELKDVKVGKTSEILSEGEQRALALAFFLAEVAVGSSDAPLVVDDPVSSLDHERRDHVAARLAEAAKTRQVIVFTHDIVFALALKKEAASRGANVADTRVFRAGSAAGRVTAGLPWRAEDVHGRVKKLRTELQTLTASEKKAADPEELRPPIEQWCKRLRDTWEQSVEEVVLGGVVYRFSPDVQTQRLKGVRVDDTVVKTVNDGMAWASKYVHDEAPAKNSPLPTCAQLAEQLSRLDGLVKS